jgi:tripartite-type tricarboxylate transporter receptor subunit TctC
LFTSGDLVFFKFVVGQCFQACLHSKGKHNRSDVLQMAGVSGLLSAVGQQAWAQAQLESLKIVTGFTPGGTSDAICRRVAEKIAPSAYTKAAFVENKSGAGG